MIEFSTLSQKIDIDAAAARRVKPEALPSATLWHRSDPQRRRNCTGASLSPLLRSSALSSPWELAPVKPRQGRFGRVLPGMAALVAYYLVLLANQNAVLTGYLPTIAGLWPAHALFATIAAAALAQSAKPARG